MKKEVGFGQCALCLCILGILSSCKEVPVNPKQDPGRFKVVAWAAARQMQANGRLGPPMPGPDDLNNLLAREFPVGTPRTEVERYLLASQDLHVVLGQIPPTSPEKKQGLHLINYERLRHYDEGFVGIQAYYDQSERLAKPLFFIGSRYSFLKAYLDF